MAYYFRKFNEEAGTWHVLGRSEKRHFNDLLRKAHHQAKHDMSGQYQIADGGGAEVCRLPLGGFRRDEQIILEERSADGWLEVWRCRRRDFNDLMARARQRTSVTLRGYRVRAEFGCLMAQAPAIVRSSRRSSRVKVI